MCFGGVHFSPSQGERPHWGSAPSAPSKAEVMLTVSLISTEAQNRISNQLLFYLQMRKTPAARRWRMTEASRAFIKKPSFVSVLCRIRMRCMGMCMAVHVLERWPSPWESKNNESFESKWDGCCDCSTDQKLHLNRRALIRIKEGHFHDKMINWQLEERKEAAEQLGRRRDAWPPRW